MGTLNFQTSLNELLASESANVQLSVPQLIEKVLERKEGTLTSTGAVCVATGKYTGRSPQDKFTVVEDSTKDKIDWGAVNQPISSDIFNRLYEKVVNHLKTKNEIFIFKGFAGADHRYRLPIQVINEYAWHNLFAQTLFIRPTKEELETHEAAFTIVSAPNFKADPIIDGTRSEAFVIVSFEKRIILIGGTEYGGEMKKSIFSIMNYLLPSQDILSMHCSANVGDSGDVALFFGLSGTGKTTLSADPNRKLIGDDEHGWSDDGIFNIEGGCYAKTINLTHEKEPQIFDAIKFGSVLENVVIDEDSHTPDYFNVSKTENTRATYPLHAMNNVMVPSMAGHPNTIIFLTADASGVLPPISKLTKEQAMYHFLSGYTSKLAGTERGITEPQATFSACFGSPFLPLHATVYADLLGKKIEKHNVNVFLVNTGWTGGEYGVGKRMNLAYTRAMITAALEGKLNDVPTHQDEIFGLHIPTEVPGVPSEVLIPQNTWANRDAYVEKAKTLAHEFKANFKHFEEVSPAIAILGGPLQ